MSKIVNVTYHKSLRGGISTLSRILKGRFPDMILHYSIKATRGKSSYILFSFIAYFRYTWLVFKNNSKIAHINIGSRIDYIRNLPYILISSFFGMRILLHFRTDLNSSFFKLPWVVTSISKFVLKRADLLIFLSPSLEEDFHRRVFEAPSISIENFITDDYFNREVIPFESRNHRIVFLGRYSREKGIDILLKAASEHISQDNQIIYECHGEGILPENLPERFQCLGWVKNPEKQEIIINSKVMVLPSFAEGLPNCLLEAMACGTPVVATTVGGIKDIIKNGIHGYLVEPGDSNGLLQAIKSLTDNKKLWESCSHNCRRDAVKYKIDAIMNKWQIVYDVLLGQKRGKIELRNQILDKWEHAGDMT